MLEKTQKQTKSVYHLPKIQQSSAVQSSIILQKYLSRMRRVKMPQYTQLNKPIAIESMKHLNLKNNSLKRSIHVNNILIAETIDRYIEILRVISAQKSSQHYRRLIRKVEDLIRTYPNISHKLFQQKDDKGLITDLEILKIKLTDQNQPMLMQIIDKIQQCNRQQETIQLYSLGHRIKLLKTDLAFALEKSNPDNEYRPILKIHNQNRSNDTISRTLAESSQKYGSLSKDLRRREQLFCKINKVVDMISSNKSQFK